MDDPTAVDLIRVMISRTKAGRLRWVEAESSYPYCGTYRADFDDVCFLVECNYAGELLLGTGHRSYQVCFYRSVSAGDLFWLDRASDSEAFQAAAAVLYEKAVWSSKGDNVFADMAAALDFSPEERARLPAVPDAPPVAPRAMADRTLHLLYAAAWHLKTHLGIDPGPEHHPLSGLTPPPTGDDFSDLDDVLENIPRLPGE